MAEEVFVLVEAADDVAVHHLHVVDIEQDFDVRGADAANDVGDVIEVIALITGMALHGVRAIAGVEVLDADGDVFLLGD